MNSIFYTILRRKLVLLAIGLSFVVFVSLSIYESINTKNASSTESKTPDEKSIYAEVLNIENKDYGYRLTCGTAYGKVLINWYNPSIGKGEDDYPWNLVGETVSLRLSKPLRLPDTPSNPRSFDMRKNLMGKGIKYQGSLNGDNIKILDKKRHNCHHIYLIIKRFLIIEREKFIEKTFDDESEALARGILFGDTSKIEEEVYQSFQVNNTAHILAASGLHVGLIFGAYAKGRKKLGKSPLGSILTASFICFLLVYGTVSQWSSSITRAISLIYIRIIADKLERRFDLLSSVSLVNIIMLLIRPYIIFNMGFQMSFFCAYAISIVIPRLKGRVPDFLIMPLGIQGFLFLYMIRQFNVIAPLGLIANLMVIILASIYVPAGVFGFIFEVIRSIILGITGNMVLADNVLMDVVIQTEGLLISSLGNMIVWINQLFYANGNLMWSVVSPGLFLVSFYMIAIMILFSETFMVLFERGRKSEKYSVRTIIIFMLTTLIISLILGYCDGSDFDEATQVFIDVGQGDAINLKWEKGIDILIDGGGQKDYSVGKKILRPYFLKNGTDDLEFVFATHKHMDHYKGIEELSEVFKIERLIDYGRAGDRIEISKDQYIEILWPIEGYEDSDDENYYSRIYMVYDKGIKTLITGDITEAGEKALIKEYEKSGKLKCHILKIAHHGSKYSSCREFLEETSPRVAVISVGKNNNYGHPSPLVIEKLEDLGIIVYRTDLDGAIGIIHRDDGFEVCTNITGKRDSFPEN